MLIAAIVLALLPPVRTAAAQAAGGPGSPGNGPRDLQAIVAVKLLRVGITRFDLPSFHAKLPDGALVGPEIDVARQIGQVLGVPVAFVETGSFDGVVELVAQGKADIGVSKLSQTYTRLHQVRFSEPYVTLRHALLFNRAAIAQLASGRPPAEVLQAYRGRVGVISGSAYVDFARRNFPGARLVETRTWTQAQDALTAGRWMRFIATSSKSGAS